MHTNGLLLKLYTVACLRKTLHAGVFIGRLSGRLVQRRRGLSKYSVEGDENLLDLPLALVRAVA